MKADELPDMAGGRVRGCEPDGGDLTDLTWAIRAGGQSVSGQGASLSGHDWVIPGKCLVLRLL